MRLTTYTEYALRVLIYLGARGPDAQRATIAVIAAAYGISENHLMKVVHHLAKKGYVDTTRGKGGGMRLARDPATISVGEIVREMEGDLSPVDCAPRGKQPCPIMAGCALTALLDRAMTAFMTELDGRTLADLLEPRAALRRRLYDRGVQGTTETNG